jgi:cell division protein ZapA
VKRSYEVSILNQKFLIKSEADERYVNRVSDYVSERIHDITNNSKSVSSLRVAILAALNIADDYFKLREKSKQKNLKTEEKVKELIAFLDHQK